MKEPVQISSSRHENIQDIRPTLTENLTGLHLPIHSELLAVREMINMYEKNLQQLKDREIKLLQQYHDILK